MHLVGIVTADHLKYLQINYNNFCRSFGHPLLSYASKELPWYIPVITNYILIHVKFMRDLNTLIFLRKGGAFCSSLPVTYPTPFSY